MKNHPPCPNGGNRVPFVAGTAVLLAAISATLYREDLIARTVVVLSHQRFFMQFSY